MKPLNPIDAGLLAPYASLDEDSRGRLVAEPLSGSRTAFQRDRDRIIHCTAFRRLKHKTQVFVAPSNDYYRTRLTHSLEVAQLARAMANTLRLNEPLAEALALAHDLGHPPFGHAGEEALNAAMQGHSSDFSHNAQALRIVTELEERYAEFNGLNLSWECLEGMAKHNGPPIPPDGKGEAARLPYALMHYTQKNDLALNQWASLEAQLAAVADDIAYNNHDLDDGLRLGMLQFEQVRRLPQVGEELARIEAEYPDLDPARTRHEMIRGVIGKMVEDVVAETSRRIAQYKIRSPEDVRNLGGAAVGFSDAMARDGREIASFLNEHMYQHHLVRASLTKAKRLTGQLFELLVREPDLLAPEWRAKCGIANDAATARTVCDYVAGMTDNFATAEYRRLFDAGQSSVDMSFKA